MVLLVLSVLSLLSLGQTANPLQSKIVGGNYVNITRYPFTVMLALVAKGWDSRVIFKTGMCGGFVISSRWVLTAAHCIEIHWILRMGITDITEDGYIADVELTHCHERHNGRKKLNDICLVRTKEKIPFSDFIKPITLVTKEEEQDIKSVTATGWGYTRNWPNEPYGSFRLKEITLSIVDFEQCIESIKINDTKLLTPAHKEHQICTREITIPDPNKLGYGICHGDSGGPMFAKTKQGTLVAVAIVSLTNCYKQHPEYATVGVGVRVAIYLDWIAAVRIRFGGD